MATGILGRFGSSGMRQLGRSAGPAIAAAFDRDPVATCMVAARFETAGMDRARLGGTFWGSDNGHGALCFVGANVVPLVGSGAVLMRLADPLARSARRAASIVGRADLVHPLWSRLRRHWGPARDIRPDQPLLVCPDRPSVASDTDVVCLRPEQLNIYFPAAVAMFTEEVGIDPTVSDNGRSYRSRVLALMSAGRTFGVVRDGVVIYEAEIGAVSKRVALVQGVWVHPAYRRRGIAAPATAAVVNRVLDWGRLPSLYVNSDNPAARATYARLGFHQAGTFASVLL